MNQHKYFSNVNVSQRTFGDLVSGFLLEEIKSWNNQQNFKILSRNTQRINRVHIKLIKELDKNKVYLSYRMLLEFCHIKLKGEACNRGPHFLKMPHLLWPSVSLHQNWDCWWAGLLNSHWTKMGCCCFNLHLVNNRTLKHKRHRKQSWIIWFWVHSA